MKNALKIAEEKVKNLELENNAAWEDSNARHYRRNSQQIAGRTGGMDHELILQLERLKDSMYTKGREINRLQNLVESIKEERDLIYREKEDQKEIMRGYWPIICMSRSFHINSVELKPAFRG